MKLNKSKPYATISGVGENHVYEQNGINFDSFGKEVRKKVMTIIDLKNVLTANKIKFNPRNNNIKSLMKLLKGN